MRRSWTLTPAFLLCALPACSDDRSTKTALALPHIKQEKLLCVPTAAAMVLAFYGDAQSPRKLKVLSRGRTYDATEPFDDFTITMYRDIIAAVGTLGYRWSEQSFRNDPNGFEKGMRLIESQLDLRRPPIIDLSVPYGHTVVVTAVDSDRQLVTVMDPEQPAPGEVQLTFDQLRDFWNEKAYGESFRSIIVTTPRNA